jgi:hypothetical protein
MHCGADKPGFTFCKPQGKLFAVSPRFSFVPLVAKRVFKLVRNGELKKVVHAEAPLPDQFRLPQRDRADKRLLKKCLAPVEHRKRGTIGVPSVLDVLPVIRFNQNSCPVAGTGGSVFVPSGLRTLICLWHSWIE